MKFLSVTKSALLMVVIVVVSIMCWEYFLRSKGYVLGYNDDEALWAKNRANIYESNDKATVFIGSSRIKFDLDQPTWEKITGEKIIQLAVAGSCPRLALENLANDEKFKGKLVIDVTEGLFFKRQEDELMADRVKYLKDVTPSQKVSAQIGFALESKFVFLDEEMFSLKACLNELPIPNREGVFAEPIFPSKFTTTDFERQEIMTQDFVRDTSIQRQVTDIWTIFGALKTKPGVSGDTLQTMFTQIQTSVAKIKARGGKVIFIRTPSSGGYWDHEPINFPRTAYWERLLSVTGCEGIHFKDYPELENFTCPEWSHLKPDDAVLYTQGLIKELEKKNWFAQSN